MSDRNRTRIKKSNTVTKNKKTAIFYSYTDLFSKKTKYLNLKTTKFSSSQHNL